MMSQPTSASSNKDDEISIKRGILFSVLGTLATGVLAVTYQIFYEKIPTIQTKLKVLETHVQSNTEFKKDVKRDLSEIKNDLDKGLEEIRKGQERFYQILLRRERRERN